MHLVSEPATFLHPWRSSSKDVKAHPTARQLSPVPWEGQLDCPSHSWAVLIICNLGLAGGGLCISTWHWQRWWTKNVNLCTWICICTSNSASDIYCP